MQWSIYCTAPHCTNIHSLFSSITQIIDILSTGMDTDRGFGGFAVTPLYDCTTPQEPTTPHPLRTVARIAVTHFESALVVPIHLRSNPPCRAMHQWHPTRQSRDVQSETATDPAQSNTRTDKNAEHHDPAPSDDCCQNDKSSPAQSQRDTYCKLQPLKTLIATVALLEPAADGENCAESLDLPLLSSPLHALPQRLPHAVTQAKSTAMPFRRSQKPTVPLKRPSSKPAHQSSSSSFSSSAHSLAISPTQNGKYQRKTYHSH